VEIVVRKARLFRAGEQNTHEFDNILFIAKLLFKNFFSQKCFSSKAF